MNAGRVNDTSALNSMARAAPPAVLHALHDTLLAALKARAVAEADDDDAVGVKPRGHGALHWLASVFH